MYRAIRVFYEKNREVLLYLIFGAFTTAVNYLIYFLLYNYAGSSATLSNIFAWIFAVLFAFFTNKLFVFKGNDWSWKATLTEVLRFIGFRVISGAIETVFLYFTVDFAGWNGNLCKIVIAVIVVLVNYLGSKLFVFKKK